MQDYGALYVACASVFLPSGIVVPISMTISIEDCCSIMQNTHCDILIVGSPKHLNAFEQIRSQLTYIKAIIKYGKGSDETSDDFHKVGNCLTSSVTTHFDYTCKIIRRWKKMSSLLFDQYLNLNDDTFKTGLSLEFYSSFRILDLLFCIFNH